MFCQLFNHRSRYSYVQVILSASKCDDILINLYLAKDMNAGSYPPYGVDDNCIANGPEHFDIDTINFQMYTVSRLKHRIKTGMTELIDRPLDANKDFSILVDSLLTYIPIFVIVITHVYI